MTSGVDAFFNTYKAMQEKVPHKTGTLYIIRQPQKMFSCPKGYLEISSELWLLNISKNPPFVLVIKHPYFTLSHHFPVASRYNNKTNISVLIEYCRLYS